MGVDNKFVPFASNRVFLTLFLHLVLGICSSLVPEKNIKIWLIINIGTAILFAIINYFLWIIHKDHSKRYFSLHSLVMMIGIAFYIMAPVFKGLYPSIFFWLLSLIILAFVIFVFAKSNSIAKALINPQQTGFKVLIMVYVTTLLLVGGVLWAFMLATDAAPWVGVSIVLFLCGLFFLMVSPAMLVKPERAREFEIGRD